MKSRFRESDDNSEFPLKPGPFAAAIDNRYDQFDEHGVEIFPAFLTFLAIKYADIISLIESYYSPAKILIA